MPGWWWWLCAAGGLATVWDPFPVLMRLPRGLSVVLLLLVGVVGIRSEMATMGVLGMVTRSVLSGLSLRSGEALESRNIDDRTKSTILIELTVPLQPFFEYWHSHYRLEILVTGSRYLDHSYQCFSPHKKSRINIFRLDLFRCLTRDEINSIGGDLTKFLPA